MLITLMINQRVYKSLRVALTLVLVMAARGYNDCDALGARAHADATGRKDMPLSACVHVHTLRGRGRRELRVNANTKQTRGLSDLAACSADIIALHEFDSDPHLAWRGRSLHCTPSRNP